jgi:hypothetical protein
MKLHPLKDDDSLIVARIPWFMELFVTSALIEIENFTLALFRSICELSVRPAVAPYMAFVVLLFSIIMFSRYFVSKSSLLDSKSLSQSVPMRPG